MTLLYWTLIWLTAQTGAGGGVTGVVVDSTAARMEGASVALISETNPSRVFRARTDKAGAFDFALLPEDTYLLEVVLPQFCTKNVGPFRLAQGGQKRLGEIPLRMGHCGQWCPVEREIQPPDVTILTVSVSQSDENASLLPLPGVKVVVHCPEGDASRQGATDRSGKVSFTGLPPGYCSARLSRRGFYPSEGRSMEVRKGYNLGYGLLLEACPKGNCDPKLRPKPEGQEILICE